MEAKTEIRWFVYLIECVNGKIYTGITTDVAKRFRKHCLGKGAKFTRYNPPLHVLGVRQCANRSQASQLEYQIKRLTPHQKRALGLSEDWRVDVASEVALAS
jgi:putative endonuclease